jgi:hypothetical protein
MAQKRQHNAFKPLKHTTNHPAHKITLKIKTTEREKIKSVILFCGACPYRFAQTKVVITLACHLGN